MSDYVYSKYTFGGKEVYEKAFKSNLQYDSFVLEKADSLGKYLDILVTRLEDDEYYLPALLDNKPDKLSLKELAILNDAINLSSAIIDGVNYGFSEISNILFRTFYKENFVEYVNEEDLPEDAIRIE